MRAILSLSALLCLSTVRSEIVIHEIHYEPEDKTRRLEFIELFNAGADSIDLSDWFFSNGVDFVFPQGASLDASSCLVVAQDPDSLAAGLGFEGALGPWEGRLSNDGERIVLRDASGTIRDQVNYGVAFPWPTLSAGDGSSMELLHTSLDNNLGGSWRASGMLSNLPAERVYFLEREQSGWRYRKGLSEPPATWREPDFEVDDSWLEGQTSIGFGDDDDNTVLDDMRGNYTTFYMRREFHVPEDSELPISLMMGFYLDDGAVVSINGVEVSRQRAPTGEIPFDGRARSSSEARWTDVFLPSPGAYLRKGRNVIAVHALNASANSGDASADFEIFAPAISDFEELFNLPPSPGAPNSVLSEDVPPQIRQVRHAPRQPTSKESATITARVTDPDGVGTVELHYQVVAPGSFIPAHSPLEHRQLLSSSSQPFPANPEFEDSANWTTLSMVDDGTGGDTLAEDSTFTAVVPTHANRSLVRYRITVTDAKGNSVRVPYRDDPSLNFAYFVYDGVPEYAPSRQTVHRDGLGHVYSPEVMTSLPVYFIITRNEDVVRCVAASAFQIPQGNTARHTENWECAFVYDGIVYDHVRFRLRGANGRYQVPPGNGGIAGKRHWRFRFNKGHHLQARDRFGNELPSKWRVLNTGRMFGNRLDGNWGLGDQVNDLLWNAYGVPAPFGHVFHWRMVDDEVESPAGAEGQYHGDFWGIARAFENYDANFLEAHDLPKGNIYKLVNQTRNALDQQRYQAPDAPARGEDHNNIESQLRGSKSEEWLHAHVDYDKWYRYHAIVQAIKHYDYWPDANKNATWYFYPEYTEGNGFLGKMWTLPFDTDATWGPTWNSGIDRPFDAIFSGRKTRMQQAYRNRVREVRDLLWQRDQLALVIRQTAAFLDALEEPDIDRWRDAPPTAGRQFFAASSQRTLEGKIADMLRFAFTGGSWPGGPIGDGGRAAFLDSFADTAHRNTLPRRPKIEYLGADGFPVDGLSFRASEFEDPQGIETLRGTEWRIAAVTPIENPESVALDDPVWREAPVELEITPTWLSEAVEVSPAPFTFPREPLTVGKNYRVRARAVDETGLTSHWSLPIEFIAGIPSSTVDVVESLRITELMYNSRGDEGFEFLEIQNIGTQTISLENVRFTDGIEFDFANASIRSVGPGGYVVIVRNLEVFETRYDTSEMPIAGAYDGSLDNAGEVIAMTYGASRVIQEFSYDDTWYSTTDGSGLSLVIRNPTRPVETWNERESWRAGFELDGSPGREDVLDEGGLVLVGDLSTNARRDVTDAVLLLRFLFSGEGTRLPCEGGSLESEGNLVLADVDGDGRLTTSDPIVLLNFLFLRGTMPVGGQDCVLAPGCAFVCDR